MTDYIRLIPRLGEILGIRHNELNKLETRFKNSNDINRYARMSGLEVLNFINYLSQFEKRTYSIHDEDNFIENLGIYLENCEKVTKSDIKQEILAYIRKRNIELIRQERVNRLRRHTQFDQGVRKIELRRIKKTAKNLEDIIQKIDLVLDDDSDSYDEFPLKSMTRESIYNQVIKNYL